jgi:Bacterial SH3 domain
MVLIVMATGCGSSGHHETVPTTSRPPASTTTTVPGVQTSGPRTVLSPIGVNVRAAANKSARVLGTAGWGSVLTVLGHTAAEGGWFEVKGATHTGWISADPTLSAAGEFLPYTSNTFSALYPPTWTHQPSPPAGTVFTSTSGGDTINASTATTTSQLARGRTGYGEASSRTVVVCGVTSDLVTYSRIATASTATEPDPYLLQIQLTLDPHHALAFNANLSDLGAPLQIFSNFLDSVTFPFPQCIG